MNYVNRSYTLPKCTLTFVFDISIWGLGIEIAHFSNPTAAHLTLDVGPFKFCITFGGR